MDPVEIAVVTAFVVLIVGGLVIVNIRNNKIRKNGIRTEGIISRIEEHESIDSDGFSEITYEYYVTYRTIEGRTVEAKLGIILQTRHIVGERINIVYMPEKPYYVVPDK